MHCGQLMSGLEANLMNSMRAFLNEREFIFIMPELILLFKFKPHFMIKLKLVKNIQKRI
jgi:hypothetical protein